MEYGNTAWGTQEQKVQRYVHRVWRNQEEPARQSPVKRGGMESCFVGSAKLRCVRMAQKAAIGTQMRISSQDG